MLRFLYLTPVGIFSHCLLPELPPRAWLLGVSALALAFLLALWRTRLRPLAVGVACLLTGFAVGGLWGHQQLDHRLPVAMDKVDLTIVGEVDSLAITRGERTVFDFAVTGIADAPEQTPPLRKLRLSWYGKNDVAPGESWQLRARLRAPRGFSNPGGFDYSGWLLSEGISATGYVRDSPSNRRLAESAAFSLHQLRGRVLARIQGVAGLSGDARGVLTALVLGEKGFISQSRFRQFQQTGTVHLVVVSGLHVAMVSALCLLIGVGVGRLAVALGSTVPARVWAIPPALAGTLGYCLLAGFDLPAQRALAMSAAALLAVLLRRASHVWHVFGLALLAVALVDPVAPLSAGFWLSFTAVLGLLAWFTFRGRGSRWRQLVVAQVVVFLALAPFLVFFLGQVSLLSLPVNLLAIPWVSLVIVPCALAGAMLQGVGLPGELMLWLAGVQVEALLGGLGYLVGWLPDSGGLPMVSLRAGHPGVLVALIAVALLLWLPKGSFALVPAATIVVALLAVRPPADNALALHVLDVGQGLAVVVRADGRTLVYDTGPGFASGFNTGEAVVAPFLSSLGVKAVDTLVVSHGDNDHAGGVAGLLRRVRVAEIYAGQPPPGERKTVAVGWQGGHCRAGEGWRWGDTRFRFLWPVAGVSTGSESNNASCVLLVERGNTRVLLPGDIGAGVERQILSALPARSGDGVTVLVAPHHGSKTSSSPPFVQRLRPDHVIFSAGFNHHFGHPHPRVTARYLGVDSRLWHTGRAGALSFVWDDDGRLAIAAHRNQSRRYWH